MNFKTDSCATKALILIIIISVAAILIYQYTIIDVNRQLANTVNIFNHEQKRSIYRLLYSKNETINLALPWTEIPIDEMAAHFTKYELESFRYENANKLLSCNWRQVSMPSYCCISSVSSGGYSVWDKGGFCLESDRNFRIKLNYYNHRKAFTTNDLFWKLQNNSKVIIIGDSVQNQLFGGFECDMIRNNYYPLNITANNKIYKKDSNLNITLMVSNSSGIEHDMFKVNYDYRYHMKYEHNVNHTYYGYKDGKKHVVNVLFMKQHRPFIRIYKERFCEWANVYLFGWELHYEPHLKYAQWIKDIGNGIFKVLQHCFDQYETLKNKPIFIWIEGSAQHFANVAGDWFDIYHNDIHSQMEYRKMISNLTNNNHLLTNDTAWLYWIHSQSRFQRDAKCIPHHFLKSKMFENNIRRFRIMEFLRNKGNNISFNLEFIYPDKFIDHYSYNTLYYIPMKDITDSLWNMHSNGDCTHWCNTPYLWQFVWDSMYRSVDKNNDEQRHNIGDMIRQSDILRELTKTFQQ